MKPDKPAPRPSRLNRRARKRIRLVALAVMSLIALSAGWMLGKKVMGPSQIDTPRSAVSMQSAIEDKNTAGTGAYPVESDDKGKIASKSDLEAKAVDAQESRDQDARQANAVQDENVRPNRKASYSSSPRHQFVSANSRRGPGIGIITKPIKVVFKPLKKANPFRLRIW